MTVQWAAKKVNYKTNNKRLSDNNISHKNFNQLKNKNDNNNSLIKLISNASNSILETHLLKVKNQNHYYLQKNKKQSVANAIGRRGYFGFQCTICGFISMDTPVAIHMTTAHSFKNPVEWKEAVLLIPVHK